MRAAALAWAAISRRASLGQITGEANSALVTKLACLTLLAVFIAAIFAPVIAPHDPYQLAPALRLKAAGPDNLLGTDAYGRDLLSRILYGGRISLFIGISASVIGIAAGLVLGLLAGGFDWTGAILMRVMDGLMAIPGILLAMAAVALWGASVFAVLAAITIPEIPRTVRLVRAIVLSAKSEPYVEAAICSGTSSMNILIRHLLPNTLAPLIVQGTFICASAILTEAILSFVGAGVSPETPTWGNIMAEGRSFFQVKPSLIFYPGIVLSLTILSINLLGDAARDALDPKMRQREAQLK
jgi:peptide/nickel transport system permease protein